jgi:hypothetical protein
MWLTLKISGGQNQSQFKSIHSLARWILVLGGILGHT